MSRDDPGVLETKPVDKSAVSRCLTALQWSFRVFACWDGPFSEEQLNLWIVFLPAASLPVGTTRNWWAGKWWQSSFHFLPIVLLVCPILVLWHFRLLLSAFAHWHSHVSVPHELYKKGQLLRSCRLLIRDSRGPQSLLLLLPKSKKDLKQCWVCLGFILVSTLHWKEEKFIKY